MNILTIITIILGALGVGTLGWSVAERLRASYLDKLELRYGERWSMLNLEQKERVLRTMGVHLWFEADRDPAHTDAKLNDLFLAVLASSGRDHGLSWFNATAARPLALLDVEVDWAFARGLSRRSQSKNHL